MENVNAFSADTEELFWEVLEAEEKPGGMLRYGIPDYRLPQETLDKEIAAILRGDVVVPATKPTARYLGERRPGHVYVPLPGATASANASRSTPAQLAAIRQSTREILSLEDDAIITINELACRDPDCPALETVVAVFSGSTTKRWKFSRSCADLTPTLLRQALRPGSAS